MHSTRKSAVSGRKSGNVDHELLSEEEHISANRVMMYIFPREYGLHNVFTSSVDPFETTQPFKDYTLREDEIEGMFGQREGKVPKRLRGKTIELVRKLQILHSRCSYDKLLNYYCPASVSIITIILHSC